jgi:hypothetical protein
MVAQWLVGGGAVVAHHHLGTLGVPPPPSSLSLHVQCMRHGESSKHCTPAHYAILHVVSCAARASVGYWPWNLLPMHVVLMCRALSGLQNVCGFRHVAVKQPCKAFESSNTHLFLQVVCAGCVACTVLVRQQQPA